MIGLQYYIFITIILKMLMESQFIFILCTSVISSPISHEWEIAPSLETDSQKDITMSFLILLLLLPLVKLEVLQNSDDDIFNDFYHFGCSLSEYLFLAP